MVIYINATNFCRTGMHVMVMLRDVPGDLISRLFLRQVAGLCVTHILLVHYLHYPINGFNNQSYLLFKNYGLATNETEKLL